MNIYRYKFEYKVYNSDGLEIDKGIETSKGYDEVRAENYLRTRLEEGCQSDEEVELKLIPSFVKYTDANKLIAEFMGVDQVDIDTWLETNSNFKYHTSWDLLMPVVKKCLDVYHIEQMNDDIHFQFYDSLGDIKLTYQAVVEFIKGFEVMDIHEKYLFYLEYCVDEDEGEIPLNFEEWKLNETLGNQNK